MRKQHKGSGPAVEPQSGERWAGSPEKVWVVRLDPLEGRCPHCLLSSLHPLLSSSWLLDASPPLLGPSADGSPVGKAQPARGGQKTTLHCLFHSVFTLGTVHWPGGRCPSLALLAVFPLEIKLMAEREGNPGSLGGTWRVPFCSPLQEQGVKEKHILL